jgi:hypothetical protein
MDRSRCVREGETALSPQRKSPLPFAAAKEGARGGTSKPSAKAAGTLHALARGEEVASLNATPTMGSPTLICRCTGYRGIVEAVSELAGVSA